MALGIIIFKKTFKFKVYFRLKKKGNNIMKHIMPVRPYELNKNINNLQMKINMTSEANARNEKQGIVK